MIWLCSLQLFVLSADSQINLLLPLEIIQYKIIFTDLLLFEIIILVKTFPVTNNLQVKFWNWNKKQTVWNLTVPVTSVGIIKLNWLYLSVSVLVTTDQSGRDFLLPSRCSHVRVCFPAFRVASFKFSVRQQSLQRGVVYQQLILVTLPLSLLPAA